MMPVLQIALIAVIDTSYVIIIIRESRRHRIFNSIWLKLKYICQESAILVFLLVLTIFAFTSISSSTNFQETKTFDVLEITVIVAVVVAIGCELIVIFYTVFDSIRTVLKTRKEKKKVIFEEKLAKMATRAKNDIGDEPYMKKATTKRILKNKKGGKKSERFIGYGKASNGDNDKPLPLNIRSKGD